MRLFVAIPLPADVKKELNQLTQPVDGIRWQNHEQLHVTLKFLGDTDSATLEKLEEKFGNIEHQRFNFSIKGLGYFPEKKHPRVLWAGVENEDKIIGLQQVIENACTETGFSPESRPFKPHVTLGKVKGASKRDVMSFINQHKQLYIPDIAVEEFILYESILKPDGAVHKPYSKFPLISHVTSEANTSNESN